MDTIGLDLHKRESQLCILAEDGTVTERRIVTSRERFTAILGNRPGACILLEASTESEWVAQHLETLGHDVIVADPNYAPMYATRARRVKTDKRDARALAEALKLGAFRAAHRVSSERRHIRADFPCLTQEFRARDVRHGIVADEQVAACCTVIKCRQGILPIRRLDNSVTQLLEHRSRRGADLGMIVDQENLKRARGRRDNRFLRAGFRRLILRRFWSLRDP